MRQSNRKAELTRRSWRLCLQGCGLWLLIGLYLPPLAAATLRVDGMLGTDSATCGSEAEPCRSIQQAVRLSETGDTVLVAEGIYTRDPSSNCESVVCVFATHLSLFGGYAHRRWVDPDPASNLSVIDGELTTRGVLVNSFSDDASLRMEGFLIRDSVAEGAGGDNLGGGLRAVNASLTLRNVQFLRNTAAGIDSSGESGESGAGGALHVSSCPPSDTSTIGTVVPPQVILQDIEFMDNSAYGGKGAEKGGYALGGALFIQRAVVDAKNLLFTGNKAVAGSSTGSGHLGGNRRADALGGAGAFGFATDASLSQVAAFDNQALGGDAAEEGGLAVGGAFYGEGGKELLSVIPGCPADTYADSPRTKLRVSDSEFVGNLARGGYGAIGGGGKGGAMGLFRSSLAAERINISGNEAGGGGYGAGIVGQAAGGGIFLEDAPVESLVQNSFVTDNLVVGDTGGGGAVRLLGSDALLIHTTIVNNSIPTGGGIAIGGEAILVGPRIQDGIVSKSNTIIQHSIIANHSTPDKEAVHLQPDSFVRFNQSMFSANARDTNQGDVNAGPYTGLETTSVEQDPAFISPGPPDFDYHLTGTSPAIDALTNNAVFSDFDDQMRGGRKDLGADEWCSAGDAELFLQNHQEVVAHEMACTTLHARDYVVLSGGDVVFQAGKSVELGNGFVVDGSADFVVINILVD